MVLLHLKLGDESQFLFETTVDEKLELVIQKVATIYNKRLKVDRICLEIPELANHGISLPPYMQGLTDDQIAALQMKDNWEDKCVPCGGAVNKKDEIGRRNGHAPNDEMKNLLMKAVEEAKDAISKKQVEANVCMTVEMVDNVLDQLKGAVNIVYPMGLPPHDPIKMEFEGQEDLSKSQASLRVIPEDEFELWWVSNKLQGDFNLRHYVGKNEKTKLIVKIQKKGEGQPGREPRVSDEQGKQMMLRLHKRQEELKKLEEADDDCYLNSDWSDGQALKRKLQGLDNIKWGPK